MPNSENEEYLQDKQDIQDYFITHWSKRLTEHRHSHFFLKISSVNIQPFQSCGWADKAKYYVSLLVSIC